ncbi:hypothetical protein HID58_003395 [Brassica napus]|uniref:CASP-like protein n=1 Tax=Brassica napus TaxID=3708 RepID=A0ABQ8CX19_BRANA|nr:hypothetical protein HID58_021116 [Brassica napus]KAH0943750.1 hypothetical protein HID58_003387 [Brassica napus]KAH0943758.1 hypothetical protein HID58_003395 [Brassica napus]
MLIMFLQLHTPLWLRISSQFQGSSKWCMITFVAKFLAALYAFITAACSAFDATVSFCHFGCVIMFAKQCLH